MYALVEDGSISKLITKNFLSTKQSAKQFIKVIKNA